MKLEDNLTHRLKLWIENEEWIYNEVTTCMHTANDLKRFIEENLLYVDDPENPIVNEILDCVVAYIDWDKMFSDLICDNPYDVIDRDSK